MSTHDPSCVFVTGDRTAAQLIVQWLQEQEINAEVQTHLPESDGVGLTPMSDADMRGRQEIHITELDRAEEIRELILQNQEELIERAQAIETAPQQDVLVTCETCGNTAVFAAEYQGTVQDCPHCGAYLDVPGGADEFDWSVVDETVAEDDLPEETEDEEDPAAWG